jgi:hypothetical protein
MDKVKFWLEIGAIVLILAATNTVVHAQASRTWVSGVGDDANPCSRTAPCKTFAGAISKTAAGGEIDALDPGGYGAVTITKAITLDGGAGQVGSILAAGTNGIIVSAGASDVVIIRNMEINGFNGSGISGIKFNTGSALIVENCKIFGFGASGYSGINFEPTAAGSNLTVHNTSLEHNIGGGILIKPIGVTTRATVNQVLLSKNGFGIRAEDGSTVSIRETVATDNDNNGFLAISASQPVVMNITDSMAVNQLTFGGSAGVKSVGGLATVRLINVKIFNNSYGLFPALGGSILSFGDNSNAGNTSDGAPTGTIVPQ